MGGSLRNSDANKGYGLLMSWQYSALALSALSCPELSIFSSSFGSIFMVGSMFDLVKWWKQFATRSCNHEQKFLCWFMYNTADRVWSHYRKSKWKHCDGWGVYLICLQLTRFDICAFFFFCSLSSRRNCTTRGHQAKSIGSSTNHYVSKISRM